MKVENEFVAFRTLWNAIPMSEQAAERICGCLNYYVRWSGNSIRELEKVLAVYKLKKVKT
jgi:hypothetical protein